jgi:hypothetical protein
MVEQNSSERIETTMWQDRLKRWQTFCERIIDSFFDTQIERNVHWVTWVWIFLLLLAGIFFWGKFLNWGRIPFNYHDWAEINAARIEFVRNALHSGQIPLHMTEIGHLRNLTDRYMSIPDAILAPQMVLLLFLQTGPFVYINTLILYFVGTFGLLQFRKRYSLSLAAFTWLFLLFNFNGYLTAHFGVGHVTWWGYFLIPWFFLLIFDALEREQGWRWVTGMAFILFLIFLQGSHHMFTWLLIFLGLFGLTSWKRFWLVIKTGAAALLLSMVRILPPILLLSKFDTDFLGGYASIQEFLAAMITLKPASQSLPILGVAGSSPLGWWEFDIYVGLIGALFILYFGVFCWVKDRDDYLQFQPLFLPVVTLFILSIGTFYDFVRIIPIPLLTGERVSSRMVIIPFLVVLLIATVYFQRALKSDRLSRVFRVTTVVLMLVTVYDLWQHMRAWRVTTAVNAFPFTPVDLSIKVVGNHPDAPYFRLIAIGALISLATAIFLINRTLNEHRKQTSKLVT